MRTMTEDAATALLRALGGRFAGFAGLFRVDELTSRNWASVTFSGARHQVSFSLEGEGAGAAADAFVAELPDAEYALRGHILADVALAGDERSAAGDRVKLRIEALTVEDN
jgi:hypothetical protein